MRYLVDLYARLPTLAVGLALGVALRVVWLGVELGMLAEKALYLGKRRAR